MYQGVRVKITVKELLQQRRAHQAASGGPVSMNSPLNPHLMFVLTPVWKVETTLGPSHHPKTWPSSAVLITSVPASSQFTTGSHKEWLVVLRI